METRRKRHYYVMLALRCVAYIHTVVQRCWLYSFVSGDDAMAQRVIHCVSEKGESMLQTHLDCMHTLDVCVCTCIHLINAIGPVMQGRWAGGITVMRAYHACNIGITINVQSRLKGWNNNKIFIFSMNAVLTHSVSLLVYGDRFYRLQVKCVIGVISPKARVA